MASTDARPLPIKNTAYRVTFPILDADGDLASGATGLDSEVSKDGGTFADCTNEATEIATSSGMYYLDLTSSEMNADCVAVIVKTSLSGAKTTPIVLYPQETGDVKVDVQSYGGTAGTFASGRPEVNTTHLAGSAVDQSGGLINANMKQISGDATAADNLETAFDDTPGPVPWVSILDQGVAQAATATTLQLRAGATFANDEPLGAMIVITGGTTGVGQSKAIIDYDGATDTATVDPWQTTPTGTITYKVYAALAAPATLPQVDVKQWNSVAVATPATAGYPVVTLKVGTGTGEVNLSTGRIPATIAAGDIGNNAITAAVLASDAGTEIAGAVWNEPLSGHVTAGTAGQAIYRLRTGTAQAGAASTITLDASASGVNDLYRDSLVVITGGTGAGQSRTIASYVGSTKIATVTPSWATTPDNTSVFEIVPLGAIAGATAPTAATVAAAVWDEVRASHVTAGTFGQGVASVQGNLTGTIANLAAGAKADVNAEVADVLTVDVVADSMAADGTRPTIAQAVLMLTRFLFERGISGTTVTARKEDGSTVAMQFSINDPTSPTSITRTS